MAGSLLTHGEKAKRVRASRFPGGLVLEARQKRVRALLEARQKRVRASLEARQKRVRALLEARQKKEIGNDIK